jgi:hypothetical protein
LTVDGTELVGNVGMHPMQMRSAAQTFAVGAHSLKLNFEQLGGDAGIRLEWQGPEQAREVVPRDAFRTDTGEPGLLGVYRQGSRHCPLDAETAQRNLRALNVRYVVSGVADVDCLQNRFGLTQTYRDEMIRIWRVPLAD